jgi:MurNAc alpha-1-phosphate uridylyltransferase
MPVAILAGGLATRLRPVTETLPKALVEIAGEPFLFHQLRLLGQSGLRRVVLCLGHLGEKVREAAGDGSRFGLEISCSFDGPELLGTGGALRRALPLLGDAFYVLYGDSYLRIDYLDVGKAFLQSEREGLMTVFKNESRHDTSNVLWRDGTLRCYSKTNLLPEMEHIDYGLGCLRRTALERHPEGRPFDLASTYEELAVRGELAGYEAGRRFYEIGSPEGMKELDLLLSRA